MRLIVKELLLYTFIMVLQIIVILYWGKVKTNYFYEYGQVDYPAEFMLWCHSSSDMTEVLNDLVQHGYETLDLGADHCSHAYVCSLRSEKKI